MNYKKGLVSVIIPTYNHEKFISETIESVLKQTYSNLEIIIMDDGSTDRNPEIISEYAKKDSRIIPILSPINEGFSKNVNKGFRKVSGEFVAKLDGDDIMMPDRIEKQLRVLSLNPDVVLCYTDAIHFNSENREPIKKYFQDSPHPTKPSDWPLGTNWFLKTPIPSIQYTTILARSEYYLANMWDERLPYKNEVLHTLDNYMSNPHGKWYFLDEPLIYYRVFPESMSKKKREELFYLTEQRIYFSIASTKHPSIYKKLKNQNNYYLFQALLFNYLTPKNIKLFEKVFLFEAGLLKYTYYKLLKFYLNFLKKTIGNK